jgi:hypothetical protein
MDPTACLKSLDDAMACRERAEIAEYADAMIGWVEKGGFLPIRPDWRGELTRHEFVCYLRDIRAVAEMV